MEESIVFRGTVDDRSLDKSADKINNRLDDAGDIKPRFDDRELQRSLPDSLSVGVDGGGADGGMGKFELASLALSERTLKYQKLSADEDTVRNRILERWGKTLADIRNRIPALAGKERPALAGETVDIGMGDGGGMGGGGALGMGALASRIPKPIAGVAAGAALPVGLVGAVGVGMLSAMHSASARLQTSTTLLGQAWNNVWRPLGDSLDQLFVRDAVKDVHSATTEFENTWRSGQQWAALIGLEGDMVGWLADLTKNMPVLGTTLQAVEFGIQTLEDIIEGKIDPWQIIKRKSRSVWEWITTETQDVWDWITTGSRSVWGWIRTGSRDVWSWIDTPNMSVWGWIDTPVKSIWDFISGGDGGGGGGNGGGGGDERPWWDPFDGPILQGGGRVTQTGVAQVHRGELVADPDRLVSELAGAIRQAGGGRGGGTVDMGTVERKLDRLHRDLQNLSRAMSSMAIQVDGETLGTATNDARRDRVSDTNPLA